MEWAYGITTVGGFRTRHNRDEVRDRRDLLRKTVVSLASAGFDNPWYFVDGKPSDTWRQELPELRDSNRMTVREPKLRTAGNWFMSLWELWIRFPNCDRYAIFQDDIVVCRNLREYLEQSEYPENGYLNLYATRMSRGRETFRPEFRDVEGWHPTTGRGLGALGLVFRHDIAAKLLTSEHMVNRFHSTRPDRPAHKFIDGGIVDGLRKLRIREYSHYPSLLQHTGMQSSMGNSSNMKSPYWTSGYDPMEQLKSKEVLISKGNAAGGTLPDKKRNSIGLVGYNCRSGLGYLNRSLADHIAIDKWLVKPHGRLPMLDMHEMCDSVPCPNGAKIERWMEHVDTVLFAETPYYKPKLMKVAKGMGKRVVCIPMAEWMPSKLRGWPQEVDLMICPTEDCYDQFKDLVPCVYFPWPCDTQRFRFQPRNTCSRFLFVNGNGGTHGRKGAHVIKEALRIWPEMPLNVVSQNGDREFQGADIRHIDSPDDNRELYKYGNVLLVPHCVDGIGLECLEAASCGMPVVSTSGEPWNEYPACAKINRTITTKTFSRPVKFYQPDAQNLVDVCKKLVGADITAASKQARQWAESRSWDTFAERLTELVRSGKPSE